MVLVLISAPLNPKPKPYSRQAETFNPKPRTPQTRLELAIDRRKLAEHSKPGVLGALGLGFRVYMRSII